MSNAERATILREFRVEPSWRAVVKAAIDKVAHKHDKRLTIEDALARLIKADVKDATRLQKILMDDVAAEQERLEQEATAKKLAAAEKAMRAYAEEAERLRKKLKSK